MLPVFTESVVRMYSEKKLFLNILQISKITRVVKSHFLIMLQAWVSFVKFLRTIFYRTPPISVSAFRVASLRYRILFVGGKALSYLSLANSLMLIV